MLFAIGIVNRLVGEVGTVGVCVCVSVCVCVCVCAPIICLAFIPVLQKEARSEFKRWWVTGDYRRASFIDDDFAAMRLDTRYEQRETCSTQYGPFFWLLLYVLIMRGSHLKKWLCPGAVACVCVHACVYMRLCTLIWFASSHTLDRTVD
jgi:hypothetical protein